MTEKPSYEELEQRIKVLEQAESERKLTEAKQIQSHDLLSNLARLVPGVIYQYRLYPDGRSAFPYASPGMADIYEVAPEEVCEDATPVYGRLHPEDYDHIVAAIQKSARTLQTFYCEFRVILARQGLCWRWSQAHPERMSDGSTLWHGIISDITERKQAEAAIAHSHELMRYVIEHANSAIAVHDRDLRYIYVSQRYLNDYKVTETDIIGRHHYDVFPDLPQKWRDVHRKALAGEISGADRDPYPRMDGTLEWTRWECRPWHEVSGAIGGIIVYTEVITERVKAEESLREKAEFQRAMISASPFAIISYAANGTVRSWNTAAEHIFGWREKEVIGQFAPIVREGQHEEFLNLCQSVIEGGMLSRIEVTRQRKDGSPIEVSLSAAPIRDREGRVDAIMAVVEDITERRRAEKEQEKLQAQLIQAQKMESVGRLAGGVAHDFNNMLGVILGYAELALEKLDAGDRLRPDMEEILAATRRSADITRQLLAFSRQQTIAPRRLDLNETLEGMLRMLRRLIGENINLSWHPGVCLWPVFMDPTQLDQILVNLCVNARDAITDVGKITIETDTKIFDNSYCADHLGFVPGDFVLLSVSDDGCGMDKATRDKIFEPFFTTKEMGKGTGLGLATVYGIIKQNNGFINVYSEPGQGTVFRIYLPRHEAGLKQDCQRHTVIIDAKGSETILLVEDEQTILKMTTKMLERLGYNVLAASSPDDAIELANGHAGEIHLLMTDVIMPNMNGRELSVQIEARYPGIRVLFMSGYTANVIAHRGVLDEGVNFIHKPFAKQDLAVKVRDILNQRSGS